MSEATTTVTGNRWKCYVGGYDAALTIEIAFCYGRASLIPSGRDPDLNDLLLSRSMFCFVFSSWALPNGLMHIVYVKHFFTVCGWVGVGEVALDDLHAP